jgi:hypothetical protein
VPCGGAVEVLRFGFCGFDQSPWNLYLRTLALES